MTLTHLERRNMRDFGGRVQYVRLEQRNWMSKFRSLRTVCLHSCTPQHFTRAVKEHSGEFCRYCSSRFLCNCTYRLHKPMFRQDIVYSCRESRCS